MIEMSYILRWLQSFLYGMSEGLTDIFVQPYKGAKEGGALGVVKGVGKGTAALATKTTSGMYLILILPQLHVN